MSEIRRLPQAESDLDGIWDYIARDAPANATRFLRRIEGVCITIADNPLMGRSREELAPALRSFPVGNYLLFYFPIEDGIEIVRVLHGSVDADSLFSFHELNFPAYITLAIRRENTLASVHER